MVIESNLAEKSADNPSESNSEGFFYAKIKVMKAVSKNIKDTEKIAKDFLNKILDTTPAKACVVGLYGNLGAGKTAFTQAVAKILGVKRKVSSPTFVIMKSYFLPLRRGSAPTYVGARGSFKKLIHIDAYRLKNEKELLHLGWEEIISNKEHLVFIEWPENVIKAMPKKHHKIKISHTEEGHRKFEILPLPKGSARRARG